jgi:hypothetical protein
VRLDHPALAALALALLAPAVLATEDASAPSPALAGPPPSEPPGPARPLVVLEGRVRSVDPAGHALVLEVGGAPTSLRVDRNTLVYLPAGLSTLQGLRPGDPVRAARNDRDVAYWIEVLRAPAAAAPPVSTPGRGTGPGGGSPAPPERSVTPAPPGGVR